MVTTLIFDWGGVLTYGSYARSLFRTLADDYDLSDDMFDKCFTREQEREICLGRLGISGWVSQIQETLNIDISTGQMRDVNHRSIHPNDDSIDLANRLKDTYRLLLFSNNDLLTVDLLHTYYPETFTPFEKCYISCELGMMKPDLGFYEYMIEDADLDVSQCLFIDDKAENIGVGEKLGIGGILFESTEQCIQDVRSLGVTI